MKIRESVFWESVDESLNHDFSVGECETLDPQIVRSRFGLILCNLQVYKVYFR